MIGLFFKKDERQRWGYGFFGAAGVAVALIQAKIAQALVAGEQFQPGRRTAFFQFLKQTGAKAVSLALGMDHQFSDQQRIPPPASTAFRNTPFLNSSLISSSVCMRGGMEKSLSSLASL